MLNYLRDTAPGGGLNAKKITPKSLEVDIIAE